MGVLQLQQAAPPQEWPLAPNQLDPPQQAEFVPMAPQQLLLQALEPKSGWQGQSAIRLDLSAHTPHLRALAACRCWWPTGLEAHYP